MMPLLGNVAGISKNFLRNTQDLSMVMSIYERESESTYPCRSLSGKRLSNAVDVVERLLVIQITGVPRSNHDPSRSSTERTAPPRSAHVQLDDDLRRLDPARESGEEEEFSSSTTAWWWWWWSYSDRASPKHRQNQLEEKTAE